MSTYTGFVKFTCVCECVLDWLYIVNLNAVITVAIAANRVNQPDANI